MTIISAHHLHQHQATSHALLLYTILFTMKESLLSKAGMAMLAYPLIVSAQQLEPILYPFDIFNVTDTCFMMLNTTVTECSGLLDLYLATP